jgi:glyoxylase I family protein
MIFSRSQTWATKAFMQRVTGIGGVFFRSNDPSALGRWYEKYLGIDPVPANYNEKPWSQEAGPTVFAPFPRDTDYFGRAEKQWMINFRVRDLDAIVEQLRADGIEVSLDPETYPNGRFARLYDPEGNRIELWEPKWRRALAFNFLMSWTFRFVRCIGETTSTRHRLKTMTVTNGNRMASFSIAVLLLATNCAGAQSIPALAETFDLAARHPPSPQFFLMESKCIVYALDGKRIGTDIYPDRHSQR